MSNQVTLTDMVRVVNLTNENSRTRWMWNMTDYTPPAGSECFMPFDCMKLYCGDPRAGEKVQNLKSERGDVQYIPDRATEVRRLMQLWQDPTVQFREVIPGDRASFEGAIPDRAPSVQVYTLNGERIYTVLDDPVGDFFIPAAPPSRFETAQKDVAIQQLTAENSRNTRLIALLADKLGINPADLDDTTAPADPAPEAGTHPVVKEDPKMVLDTRHNRVIEEPTSTPDPTNLSDIPESL